MPDSQNEGNVIKFANRWPVSVSAADIRLGINLLAGQSHFVQCEFQDAHDFGSISGRGQQRADRERCGSQYRGGFALEYSK